MERDTKDAAPIDPLHRVFVPKKTGRDVNRNWTFQTSDGVLYYEDDSTGMRRRKYPKVNGKLARKARRRNQREHHARADG